MTMLKSHVQWIQIEQNPEVVLGMMKSTKLITVTGELGTLNRNYSGKRTFEKHIEILQEENLNSGGAWQRTEILNSTWTNIIMFRGAMPHSHTIYLYPPLYSTPPRELPFSDTYLWVDTNYQPPHCDKMLSVVLNSPCFI